MPLFDPARYTHNLSGQSNRRSVSLPPIFKFSDQRFLDQVAETTKIFNIKKIVLPEPVMNMEEAEDGEKWREKKLNNELSPLSDIIKEREKERKEKELKEKGVLLRGGERELWGRADWRERDKDLEQNFLKLSPIRNGRKIVRGKGETYNVDS